MKNEFPKYTPSHYKKLMSTLDPVELYGGYSVKRGDNFHLGSIVGSKVRQCLHVVHTNLDHIKKYCNGGILTAAGLPSPQTMIVSAVAKYFGLKCAITTPKFDNTKKDFNRINASMAQKLGADIYGVGNPNPAGPECDAKYLVKELGYYQIKFGMCGDVAMQPVANQVQNIPNYISDIVIISGSGLSALSIMLGISMFKKKVKTVHAVCLSNHILKNKEKWFDDNPLSENWKGKLNLIQSSINYRTEYKWNKSFDWDLTYESKAYKWMTDNFKPSKKVLFWVVGRKLYDLNLIEPIKWHMSEHEKELREPISNPIDNFFVSI
jgi:1-aminocyclopropane-1-carboxylate deaminase/D-cysteine desulfhydrase-like pyridoxal-dependent ACC family enzyme